MFNNGSKEWQLVLPLNDIDDGSDVDVVGDNNDNDNDDNDDRKMVCNKQSRDRGWHIRQKVRLQVAHPAVSQLPQHQHQRTCHNYDMQ